MENITTELLQILDGLGDSATYCATGIVGAVLPGLEVVGVGDVGIPVSAEAAKKLIQQAAQAPYGRGEETIVDPNVRRVWQLEPNQFALRNAEWKSCLQSIVDAVRLEFGITQKVDAQIYKLLVYEQGSFFAPHRDSEKAERMFATLVVCLPSKHEGGTLVVSHDGQTRRVDFGGAASQFQLQYAAFYADCQHEITPVASGYRVCLVYNLSIAKSKRQPSAPVSSDAIDLAADALSKIFADPSRDKIAIPLTHQYTEAGLGDVVTSNEVGDNGDDEDWDEEDWDDDEDDEGHRQNQSAGESDADNSRVVTDSSRTTEPSVLQLKGSDQARMDVLARAASKVGYQANVALLTHWQSGSVDCGSMDYSPNRSRRDRYRGGDNQTNNAGAEFEEVFDESMSLSHWFDSTGHRLPFQTLNIEEGELMSAVDPKDRPYRQEIHEATGNEGVSMDRWYHQAVVVIWPQDRFFGILAGAGPVNAVPALEELVGRTAQPKHEPECCRFAKEIIARWRKPAQPSTDSWSSRPSFGERKDNEKSLTTRMLQVLAAIGDDTNAIAFVRDILPTSCDGTEGAELTRLIDQLGWGKFAEPLQGVFSQQKPSDYGRELMAPVTLFAELCCCTPKQTKERLSVCRSLADELEQAIERWDRRKWDSWQRKQDHRIGIVEPVVRAFSAIEATDLLERFVARVTNDPTHYDLHAVLIPAVTTLLSDQSVPHSAKTSIGRSAIERIHQHCLSELQALTSVKPQPPADWSRDSKLDCKCADCLELAAFLKNKDESVHRFRRRKELRQHLHRKIDQHHCDVTHVTERQGSPQTLVCTKTQASFDRRLTQYETDLRLLGELLRLPLAADGANKAAKKSRRDNAT